MFYNTSESMRKSKQPVWTVYFQDPNIAILRKNFLEVSRTTQQPFWNASGITLKHFLN